MRITNPTALTRVAANRAATRPRAGKRTLRHRLNAYTLWAFNPQRELTSRYQRED